MTSQEEPEEDPLPLEEEDDPLEELPRLPDDVPVFLDELVFLDEEPPEPDGFVVETAVPTEGSR